ncbi:MAG: 2-polyprenyl-6-hydroxyphenyl methylase/3-demethylubiquinone-9 3-methyltransferase [Flavobacterium sp.]|jgi:2-polyprenyl-6-hydroxyphenyl methylase/3-demethylubiquinone-9 3-methyltransferase
MSEEEKLEKSTRETSENVDPIELSKFDELARKWWDKNSVFKPLHDINPLRLNYITSTSEVRGKRVLDVGCGGGILTEALAAEGAIITGIDMAEKPLQVAKLHRHESGLDIDYQLTTIENFAREHAGEFDIITCLEMLEHVPDPNSIIKSCKTLLKPDGDLYLSTINRNAKAYLFAVVGAEYILNLLARGTHDYEKFIKPSELAKWLRESGFTLQDLKGMTYNPITKVYKLSPDTSVNYLLHAKF